MQYSLIVNGGTRNKVFDQKYTYRQTKNIALAVGKNKGTVYFSVKQDYRRNLQSDYLNDLLKDSIQRLALANLLLYEETLTVNNAVLEVISSKGLVESFDISDSMRMHSLINRKLLQHVPVSLKQREFVGCAITQKKTNPTSPVTALNAYLYSRTKDNEFEKFMYLWMATMGYSKSQHKINANKDRDAIIALVNELGSGNAIFSTKTRTKVGKRMMLIIQNNNDRITTSEQLLNDSKLIDSISNLIKENNLNGELSAYGYCLLDFSYYLRCTYFHADEPIPLSAFDNDMALKSIRFVNDLLEEFLDEKIVECIHP